MTFVRNAWYVAAWSRDLGRTLTPRQILGENVVLYRTEDGSPVALRDQCPHRLLPLSMGTLQGDAVQCGYHGMTFDAAGRCIRIPGQERMPAHAEVRSYPVTEQTGLVWIWMGEAERADPEKIFDLPQYHDPAWRPVHGDALAVAADYLSLADNLCDPAHVTFVHQSTLGTSRRAERRLVDEGDVRRVAEIVGEAQIVRGDIEGIAMDRPPRRIVILRQIEDFFGIGPLRIAHPDQD